MTDNKEHLEALWADLLSDAKAEAYKAIRKFPQPNYVISKFAEEAGEVVKAAIHFAEKRETAANVRAEMVQSIAMIFRLWIEGDEIHGLPAIATAYVNENDSERRTSAVNNGPCEYCVGGLQADGETPCPCVGGNQSHAKTERARADLIEADFVRSDVSKTKGAE